MTKLIRNNQKGFTLIELMIVVAIIGILAAIAIPNFLNYQLKSKSAEAKVNLGAIATSEEAYRAENDTYLVCAPNAVIPGGGKADFGGNADFTALGFAPSGQVYYSYQVYAIADITSDFMAMAEGDLDENGGNGGAMGANVAGADADDGCFSLDNDHNFNDDHPGIW